MNINCDPLLNVFDCITSELYLIANRLYRVDDFEF